MRGCVVAGIGTEVGKTIVSAVLVEHLQADYWKPVQAGGLDHSDAEVVRQLAPSHGAIHPEAWRLNSPMSPHAAAELDGVRISVDSLDLPATDRFLVVELAGGLMVPLNDRSDNRLLNIDLIDRWDLPVVLVSSDYLGSINHTLLSIAALRERRAEIAGLVFNGAETASSRTAIRRISKLDVLFELPRAERLEPGFITSQANRLQWP